MKKKNVTKYVIAIVVILILIISYALYNKETSNFNNVKIDKSKYLVYTASETQFGNYNQYKPYVNIKGDSGIIINKNIEEYMSSFANNNICITYEYDVNGKILSLVIKVEDYSFVESAAILYFRTYNINLETSEILSKDNLLELFNTNSSVVEQKLNNKIEEYYSALLKENTVDSNCDFSCFKSSRDFKEGMEDAEYYVRDGKLIVFKPYTYLIPDEEKNIVYDFEIDI